MYLINIMGSTISYLKTKHILGIEKIADLV